MVSVSEFALAAQGSEGLEPQRADWLRRRMVTYWVVGISLTVSYAFLRGSTWIGSGHLHTIMEVAATLLALMVGAMALVRFYSKKSNTFLLIGTAFFGTAFLDGYHAVVTSEFFAAYLPSDLPSLIPWSWIASRLFLSIMLFLSWLVWLQMSRRGLGGQVRERTVYVVSAVLTLASFLFFAFVPLPPAYYPEIVFHRPEEFVPALFFALALVGYLRKGEWTHDAFEHWLVLALIVSLVSQTVFMSYSGRLFDMEFDAAHLLKKVSYVCVLIGLLINMHAVFRRAEASAKRLAEANAELQNEITERGRAETALARRAAELSKSNAELEQFASVASHDLQEPLRKIQAFGDRLESKYGDVLNEEGRDYVARMRDAASRMQTLTTDLLTFSRVSTQGRPFELVNLDQVVREVLSDLEIAIQESGAKIEISGLQNLHADRLQLRQLFQNLIGNALKYHRENVQPVIRLDGDVVNSTGILRQGPSIALLRLQIEDNGIGFDQQYANRIFGIFQRLHGRREYSGTGVGLAICRKIIDRHGGIIKAEGRPGKGSTFTIHLPLRLSETEKI